MGKKRRVRRCSHGTRTGAGICSWIAALFAANEVAPRRLKLTDDRILELLVAEFPSSRPVMEMDAVATLRAEGYPIKQRISINRYRGWFNAGRLTRGVKPVLESRRYDDLGDVIHNKTGKPIKENTGWQTRLGRLRSEG